MSRAASNAEYASPSTGRGRRIHGLALISVLAALALTLLLEALDQTVVATASPKIIADLQGFDRYTWVATAYLLASTTMIPIVGKLSDQFGRKWFFLVGVVIFLVGSALSGAAQTMDQLIAFRAIQGLGAGMGIALVFTVVGDIFPPAQRARWQGIFSGVYGFSSVVGPTIGGWLTDHGPLVGTFITDASRWRWIFYLNLPLGFLALGALLIALPANISVRSSRHTGWAAVRRIDVLGALLASGVTICLLLGLTWGGNQTDAWTSPQVLLVLLAAAVLFLGFFLAERFAVEPLLPLTLFKNQVFAADALLALTSGMVLLALVYYLPLFLQGVLGASATNAGEVITPLTLSLVVGSALAGFAIARMQRYRAITVLGAVTLAVGVFLLSRMTPTTSLLTASLEMVVAGLGLGMFFPVMTLAVQNALSRTQIGVGTGAITYLRQLGQTLGVAIAGTIVNNTITSDLASRLSPDVTRQLSRQAVHYASNPQALVDPTYRQTVIRLAEQFAVRIATLQVPPGPQHDQTVKTVTAQTIQQTQALLNQVFAALRQSLAVGIQHSLVAVLLCCAGVILAACFLKDVPLAQAFRGEVADEVQVSSQTTAD